MTGWLNREGRERKKSEGYLEAENAGQEFRVASPAVSIAFRRSLESPSERTASKIFLQVTQRRSTKDDTVAKITVQS
jgi:hypothetical protein